MSEERKEEPETRKERSVLDEDDIKLLKSYVRERSGRDANR